MYTEFIQFCTSKQCFRLFLLKKREHIEFYTNWKINFHITLWEKKSTFHFIFLQTLSITNLSLWTRIDIWNSLRVGWQLTHSGKSESESKSKPIHQWTCYGISAYVCVRLNLHVKRLCAKNECIKNNHTNNKRLKYITHANTNSLYENEIIWFYVVLRM